MTRSFTSSALRLLSLLLGLLVVVGLLMVGKNLGWLPPIGINSESHDSQVIQAIERTQEVSLLGLGIQGLKEENKSGEIFGQRIPGTGERVFLQYNFRAKLGIDGTKVKITKTSPTG